MPLYEYQCEACGRRFERIQKFSDPPIETCPTCGGHVHKMVSSPAFQFKGTGWYVTDYSRKEKAGTGSESEPTAKDGKDTETKGAKEGKDAKPPAESTAAKESPSTPANTKAAPSKS